MRYLFIVLNHKWNVYKYGRMLNIPRWRLFLHDWTKLLPSNYIAYSRRFVKEIISVDFNYSWLRHQNTETHHWEYWIPRSSGGNIPSDPSVGNNKPLRMPEVLIREMVADWIAAAITYEGKFPDFNNWTWFEKNKDRILANLHHYSRHDLYNIIEELKELRIK